MNAVWKNRILVILGAVVFFGAAGLSVQGDHGHEPPLETWVLGLPGERQEIIVRAEGCTLNAIDQRGFSDSHEDAMMEALCWKGRYGFFGPEERVFEGVVLYGYRAESVEVCGVD